MARTTQIIMYIKVRLSKPDKQTNIDINGVTAHMILLLTLEQKIECNYFTKKLKNCIFE